MKKMKFLRQLLASCALLGALVGTTAAVAADAPSTPGAKPPAKDLVLKGDAKCTTCHDESDEPKLLHIGKTKHGTVADGRTPSCTNCHGDSDLHTNNPAKLKERPATDRSFGKNSKTPVEARNESCISCHKKDAKRSHWEGSAHQRADVACTSCHQLHTAKDKVADKRTQPEVCFTCHKEQRAQVMQAVAPPGDGRQGGLFGLPQLPRLHRPQARQAR
jgi:predicted CXXCH cytochrome family protein